MVKADPKGPALIFSLAQDLLREERVQATTRQELRQLLANRPSGGIVFATIQKFMPGEDEDIYPMLSDRHNIVVIADEAHRPQYGFEAKLKTLKKKNSSRTTVHHLTDDAAATQGSSAAMPVELAGSEYITKYQVGCHEPRHLCAPV